MVAKNRGSEISYINTNFQKKTKSHYKNLSSEVDETHVITPYINPDRHISFSAKIENAKYKLKMSHTR